MKGEADDAVWKNCAFATPNRLKERNASITLANPIALFICPLFVEDFTNLPQDV